MSLALMSNKPSLDKFSSKQLAAELYRRFKQKQKRTKSSAKETCSHCGQTSKLKEWSHMRSYWFEDNVYTQNHRLSDDIHLICPNCTCVSHAHKNKKYETLDTKSEIDLFKRIKKFEEAGGKFKHYYQEYDNGYGFTPDYYESEELYCAEFVKDSEKLKVKKPYNTNL